MKLIEALKGIKDLQRKADDLEDKVKQHCAITSKQTPEYGDNQEKKINGWIQAHKDIVKEILRLRIAIQRTNLSIAVAIEIGDKKIAHSIAAWIHRRRDLAGLELSMWQTLTDRGITEGAIKYQSGDMEDIKIVRYFDPVRRDNMKELLTSEPSIIDGRLEIVNATTDLIEN